MSLESSLRDAEVTGNRAHEKRPQCRWRVHFGSENPFTELGENKTELTSKLYGYRPLPCAALLGCSNAPKMLMLQT